MSPGKYNLKKTIANRIHNSERSKKKKMKKEARISTHVILLKIIFFKLP